MWEQGFLAGMHGSRTQALVEASSDGSSTSKTGVDKQKAGHGHLWECIEVEGEQV